MMTTEVDSPSSLPDTIRATSRGRLSAIALAGVAAGLVAFFYFYGLPVLNAAFGPAHPSRETAIVKCILVGITALVILCALTMMREGRRILRSGQCPPPEAIVWRDTKIQRGQSAIRLARAYIIAGIAAGILCASMTAYIWTTLNLFKPQIKLGPGITILQEKHWEEPSTPQTRRP